MNNGTSVLHGIPLDESTSSSEAADILIRSTKVVSGQNRDYREGQREASKSPSSSNVNIYVRRLSETAHGSCSVETSTHGLTEKIVPPVLPVNMRSALSRGIYNHIWEICCCWRYIFAIKIIMPLAELEDEEGGQITPGPGVRKSHVSQIICILYCTFTVCGKHLKWYTFLFFQVCRASKVIGKASISQTKDSKEKGTFTVTCSVMWEIVFIVLNLTII